MADDLQENLSRIRTKMSLLLERYRKVERLLQEERENGRQKDAEILRLTKEVETRDTELEYLKLVRSVASSPSEVARSKDILVQLVRDVDKCISQLNE